MGLLSLSQRASAFGYWYASLWNYPPQERYKFDNILLTGLWYGKSKPNVPVFLKHFVNELSDLANGTDFEDDTGQPIPSVCRIQSIVPDLPAKALFLNIKQFNGQFGCSTCKHPCRYDRELKARVFDSKMHLPVFKWPGYLLNISREKCVMNYLSAN